MSLPDTFGRCKSNVDFHPPKRSWIYPSNFRAIIERMRGTQIPLHHRWNGATRFEAIIDSVTNPCSTSPHSVGFERRWGCPTSFLTKIRPARSWCWDVIPGACRFLPDCLPSAPGWLGRNSLPLRDGRGLPCYVLCSPQSARLARSGPHSGIVHQVYQGMMTPLARQCMFFAHTYIHTKNCYIFVGWEQ